MALFNIACCDLSEDLEHFENAYKKTPEEFIEMFGKDNITIDLTGKIVISLRADPYFNLPIDLMTILIPEEDKYKYKATLIYSGHIAFIKLEYKDRPTRYLFKNDECCPLTFTKWLEETGDSVYCCEENGFKSEDISLQIEKFVQSIYDYNYKFDAENIIILEGL